LVLSVEIDAPSAARATVGNTIMARPTTESINATMIPTKMPESRHRPSVLSSWASTILSFSAGAEFPLQEHTSTYRGGSRMYFLLTKFH